MNYVHVKRLTLKQTIQHVNKNFIIMPFCQQLNS